jgi:hypothetical protein
VKAETSLVNDVKESSDSSSSPSKPYSFSSINMQKIQVASHYAYPFSPSI